MWKNRLSQNCHNARKIQISNTEQHKQIGYTLHAVDSLDSQVNLFAE